MTKARKMAPNVMRACSGILSNSGMPGYHIVALARNLLEVRLHVPAGQRYLTIR